MLACHLVATRARAKRNAVLQNCQKQEGFHILLKLHHHILSMAKVLNQLDICLDPG